MAVKLLRIQPKCRGKYIASDTCLHTHSNTSHISAPKVRSIAGAHFPLNNKPATPTPLADVPINGPIHVICKITKCVMGSAAEVETGAGFLCAKEILPIWVCLEEMRHPQPPTPMQIDNSTAESFANKLSNKGLLKQLT